MHLTTLLLLSYCGLISAAVHFVEVGSNGSLVFVPERTTADKGDTVVFHLYATHDVVQGDFASPCTPNAEGFYSGPYSDSDRGSLRFVVNVTDTNPIYYYCSVARHCQQGMVGGINLPLEANNTRSIEAYKQAAGNVTAQATAPTERRGGELRSDDQLRNLTSPSSVTPFSYAPTATGTTSSSSASVSTAAAIGIKPEEVNGVAALIFGIAAWML